MTNSIKTKIELEGTQKAVAESKVLRTELEALSKAAQTVFGASGGLYSPKSLGSQPALAQALQQNAKVMAAMRGGSGGGVPPRIGGGSGSGGGDKFNFNNPLNLPGKMGELYSQFTKLHLVAWQLAPVFLALGAAVQRVTKAMVEGAELYTKAAQLGRNPSDLFRARLGAKVAGVSPDQVQDFMLRQGAGKGSAKDQGNFNKLASFKGLAKEASEAMSTISDSQARFVEKFSGQAKNVEIALARTTTQFDLLWMTLSSKIANQVRLLIGDLEDLFRALQDSIIIDVVAGHINFLVVQFRKLSEGIGLLFQQLALSFQFIMGRLSGKDFSEAMQEKMKKFFTEGWGTEDEGRKGNRNLMAGAPILPMGQWEKLGLSLGGGIDNDAAKRTADNTGKMVNLLQTALGMRQKVNPVEFSLSTPNAP